MPTHSRIRLAASLAVLSAIQIVVVFLAQIYVMIRVGASREADVFFASQTFPQLVRAVGLESFTIVLIPILKSEADGGKSLYLPLLATWCAVLVAPAVAFYFWGGAFSRVFFPGFEAADQFMAMKLGLVQVPGLFGYAAFVVAAAYHHVEGRFVTVARAGVAAAVIGLAITIAAFPRYGIEGAAVGQAVIAGGSALFLLRSRHCSRPDRRGAAVVARAFRRTATLGAGGLASRTVFVADRFFASLLPPGVLAIIDVANRIAAALVRIVSQSMVAPVVPLLSEIVIGRDVTRLWKVLRRRMVLLTASGALSLAAAVSALVGGAYLWRVSGAALEVSGLDPAILRQLGVVSFGLGGVYIFGTTAHLLNSAYYAHGLVLAPVLCGAAAQALGIAMKFLLQPVMGGEGLVVATSIQYAGMAMLLYVFGRRRFGRAPA